jgi:cytoskeletal protein CcmA (bactofilin family)
MAERMRIDNSGKVGIGITNPAYRLDVQGGQINTSGGLCIAGDCRTSWPTDGVSQWTTSGTNIFYNSGNVGIGTSAPSSRLHVAGDVFASGTITAGNIVAKYQDIAEWVPARHTMTAGTVVVLDTENSNQVIASQRAYDTRVAGVISATPGVILGEAGEGKVMVATTGRVRVKVDATRAPIHVGDLLVTSDKEGVAMRSEPLSLGGTPIHRPGTLIGKALEPLDKGVGEILVLLSLQ